MVILKDYKGLCTRFTYYKEYGLVKIDNNIYNIKRPIKLNKKLKAVLAEWPGAVKRVLRECGLQLEQLSADTIKLKEASYDGDKDKRR